jgi:ABC-type sugar transport system ATPase subunit
VTALRGRLAATPIWWALLAIVAVGWAVLAADGGELFARGNVTNILQRSVALGQSVRDNTLLGLRSHARRGAGRRRSPTLVDDLARATELRARSLEQEVRFLSGGNQQKVVLAKWLALEPGVLLFDEPTRGIDVGAKAAIHALMRGLARQGRAVVMISSELPELIGMSDRIVVMHEGRIAGELPAGATEQQVIALAAGHAVDEAVA